MLSLASVATFSFVGVRVFEVCHEGAGMSPGVVRELSFSKWACIVMIRVWGSDAISFVNGFLMVVRMDWSLAHGCSPAVV